MERAEKKTDNSANKMLRIIFQKRARWDSFNYLSESFVLTTNEWWVAGI
jgi:hypothetical protein